MSEKVVVPKFEIPSETTHPAIKIIASIAVLLLGTTAILGIAIWHRRSEQMAAVAKRDAIIAARAADAKAAVEKAKAQEEAKRLAKEAARKADKKPSGPKSTRDNAAIDKLLASFK